MRKIKRKNKGQTERESLLGLRSSAYALRDRWRDSDRNIFGSEAEELEELIDRANRLDVGAKTPYLLEPVLGQERMYEFEQSKTAVEIICRKVENKIKILDDENKKKILKLRHQRSIFLYLWSITFVWAAIYTFLSKHSANLSKSYLNIFQSIQNIIFKVGLLPLLIAERRGIIRWFKRKFRGGERIMIEYRRKNGTDAWHWCTNCSNWPTEDYKTYCGSKFDRPSSGELDNECRAKERDNNCPTEYCSK